MHVRVVSTSLTLDFAYLSQGMKNFRSTYLPTAQLYNRSNKVSREIRDFKNKRRLKIAIFIILYKKKIRRIHELL